MVIIILKWMVACEFGFIPSIFFVFVGQDAHILFGECDKVSFLSLLHPLGGVQA